MHTAAAGNIQHAHPWFQSQHGDEKLDQSVIPVGDTFNLFPVGHAEQVGPPVPVLGDGFHGVVPFLTMIGGDRA